MTDLMHERRDDETLPNTVVTPVFEADAPFLPALRDGTKLCTPLVSSHHDVN